MTIAVTDACIFIELVELDLVSEFFNLRLDVHTTVEVWNEIIQEQQIELTPFVKSNTLTIHNLTPENFLEMNLIPFPRSLSDPDKSVIFIASKLNAILLSSDGPVRKFAHKSSIERHGMLWVLDELVDKDLITSNQACEKLEKLSSNNMMYLNNSKLQLEIKKRLEYWSVN